MGDFYPDHFYWLILQFEELLKNNFVNNIDSAVLNQLQAQQTQKLDNIQLLLSLKKLQFKKNISIMEKPFNLARYKELLKLHKNGSISLLDELGIEYLSYSGSVTSQISYNRKGDYFLLINQYLSQTITPYEFRSQFLEMENQDSKKANVILRDFKQ